MLHEWRTSGLPRPQISLSLQFVNKKTLLQKSTEKLSERDRNGFILITRSDVYFCKLRPWSVWPSIVQVHWTFHWLLYSLYIKALRIGLKLTSGSSSSFRMWWEPEEVPSSPGFLLMSSSGSWRSTWSHPHQPLFLDVSFSSLLEPRQELVWESSCYQHLNVSARLFLSVILSCDGQWLTGEHSEPVG